MTGAVITVVKNEKGVGQILITDGQLTRNATLKAQLAGYEGAQLHQEQVEAVIAAGGNIEEVRAKFAELGLTF